MKRTLLAASFLMGCTTTSDEIAVVESASSKEWAEADCPDDVCGMNGNNMGWYFNELDLDHQPNNAQVVFVKFDNLQPAVHHIEVRMNRLVAVDVSGIALPNSYLVNTVIVLVDRDSIAYRVRIHAVNNSAKYWAANVNGELPIETYTLRYRKMTPAEQQREHDFCDAEPLAGAGLESDAVVFKGDRYNAVTKAITTVSASSWFNVACLGSVPAKMFMMRHTSASSNALKLVTTTTNEKRALINAWTANYCGDGRSFTHTGEELLMRDHKDWIAHKPGWSWSDFVIFPNTPFSSYEALWDENGAVCLDVPRRKDSDLVDEETYDAIQAHCMEVRGAEIPRCTEGSKQSMTGWQEDGHILTVNPHGS